MYQMLLPAIKTRYSNAPVNYHMNARLNIFASQSEKDPDLFQIEISFISYWSIFYVKNQFSVSFPFEYNVFSLPSRVPRDFDAKMTPNRESTPVFEIWLLKMY